MLDFGACKKYKKSFVKSVLQAQQGVWERDRSKVENALLKLDIDPKDKVEVIDGYVDLVFRISLVTVTKIAPTMTGRLSVWTDDFSFPEQICFKERRKWPCLLLLKRGCVACPGISYSSDESLWES